MLKNFELNKEPVSVKRALISVSNKDGVVSFAGDLADMGVEILSTGGTSSALSLAGIPVRDVSDFTGFPEIMNGRVKTLHPRIAGGILGLCDVHHAEAENNNIEWIDLVVCNLYPFHEAISRPETSLSEALENIDIGGPTMIRAAAKNTGWTTVLVDPGDYGIVITELRKSGAVSFNTRCQLSTKAFGHTARYDSIIHNYLEQDFAPDDLSLPFEKVADLRYGENPHQAAAVYASLYGSPGLSILSARIHQGKQLSYNNIMDADGALSCLREFTEPACVVVKHANPCGVAIGGDNIDNILDVYTRAFNADSLSAFGGIVALNRNCTADVARKAASVFIEILIAPSFDKEALEILSKKKNLRVLDTGELSPREKGIELRNIEGGILVQEKDTLTIGKNDLRAVTKKIPDAGLLSTMLFGWKVLKYVKSNGILIVNDNTTVGIGAGQVSRVDAVDIALRKAGERSKGAVLCSDAFFPFRDSIDKLAGTGVRAVIQPGGSIRDKEVIEACNEQGIVMVFTGSRCFKH